MIQIQSTQNVGVNGIKSLIYGPPGSGKTVLCSTAPAPIIISAESGLLSLRKMNLPFIEIKTMGQLIEVYNWCLQSNEARQFYTICIDSISEIMEVLLTSEKQKTKDPRKAYGELADQGVGIARAFRDLPGRSVVILAKEEYDKDDTTGMMMYGPMLPGKKLGPQLPYFFDEVFQLVVGKDAAGNSMRALRTRMTMQHTAKDRSGSLNEWEEANLQKIFTKILAA
jgi:hypothetical protein